MYRIIISILIAGIIASCKPGASEKTDQKPSYQDYCDSFTITLNGVFANKHQEGTMTWAGGLKGQVEIAGVDYNEMTCTYAISDCEGGFIDMVCNGAAYNTEVKLFSPDSMMLGPTTYVRVK